MAVDKGPATEGPLAASAAGSIDQDFKTDAMSSIASFEPSEPMPAAHNLVKMEHSRSNSLSYSKGKVRPIPLITKKKSDVSSIVSVHSTKFQHTPMHITPMSVQPPDDQSMRSTVSSAMESPSRLSVSFANNPSLKRGFTIMKPNREVARGTPVNEGHANYMLMYDMLTGIRVSVSRCNAKPVRDLLPDDFEAAHKIAFDVTGNELAPSSRYDFKFKDYSPWIFRLIRECFRVDPTEYLLSLTGKYVLSELGSPGKSGSFFYFSQDFRFIIKTIHFSEHKFIRRVLKNYFEHVKANPDTLLSRIFGLHRVKLPGNKKIHFVVMGNVFPPNKDIHETYDLKGSTVGRMTSEEKARKYPGTVLKDLNWLKRERKLFLGPVKRKILVDQMEKDVTFLKKMNIMDYSLLIGIHDLIKGNSHNIRDSVLSVIEPSAQDLSMHQMTNIHRRSTLKSPLPTTSRRKPTIEAESIKPGAGSARLLQENPPERSFCVFYKDLGGGFLATNEANESLRDLYYIGIIDIFTEYNVTKKAEHFFKSVLSDRHKISAVKPAEYGDRFLYFMRNAIHTSK